MGDDAAELRLRMTVCLGVAELRELGDTLGVPALEASSAAEAAAAIVRHFEREGALATLVTTLRETKPLVEWPEPQDAVVDEPASETPAEVPAMAEAPPAPEAAEIAAPLAEEPESAPPSAWIPPGHKAPDRAESEARPGRGGLDPRILVLVSALSLVAAIVAYAAGRAGKAEGEGPAKSAVEDEATLAARAKRPSARAAALFDKALIQVARACEVEVDSAAATTKILAWANEWCGPVAPDVRQRRGALRTEPRPAETAPILDDLPHEPPPPPRPRGGPGTGATLTSGCIGQCDATHRACKKECGAEPTEGSLYGAYQTCLGKCLKEASGCRLECAP